MTIIVVSDINTNGVFKDVIYNGIDLTSEEFVKFVRDNWKANGCNEDPFPTEIEGVDVSISEDEIYIDDSNAIYREYPGIIIYRKFTFEDNNSMEHQTTELKRH